jgi:predicted glycoside hydrolase/deacetylase ChbG (UPF0249 family)
MRNYRKNIIISADDFGISQLANKNILLLAKSGKLNRVAVMTNGNFSQKEIEALKKTGVKLDLHLDLASKIPAKRKLKAGILFRTTAFLLRHLQDRINKNRKKLHWEEQLGKFQEIFNKNPDGLNSHQHIHFFPFYFKIALQLTQEKNIGFIRFGKKGIFRNSHKIRHILSWLRTKDLKTFLVANLNSSDYMISLDWIKNVPKFIKDLPDDLSSQEKIEIVCHPERKEEFEIIKKYF